MFKKSNKKLCPMLKKPCIEHECAWYIHIRGSNPNTGEEVDSYDCSMVIQPLLLIENSSQQRSTGAAIESFRNEMVQANNIANHINNQMLIATTNASHSSNLLIKDVKGD